MAAKLWLIFACIIFLVTAPEDHLFYTTHKHALCLQNP